MGRPFAPENLGERLRACVSTQEQVRVTMAAFGGYWRPLAAVARLLEELGELIDELRVGSVPGSQMGAELADLWIITTALADQYLAEVREPPRQAAEAAADRLHEIPSTAALISSAGRIARIVNHYDGPKMPRSDSWMSIGTAVAVFHDALAEIAEALRIDLAAAVQTKLLEIPALDSGRFSVTWHDPATAACLTELRRVVSGPLATSRLWGAPDWQPGSIAANAEAIVPSLLSFTKAARAECLDAYVIPGPPSYGEAGSDRLHELLQELSARDPQPHRGSKPGMPALIFGGLGFSADRHPATGQRSETRAFTCLRVRRSAAPMNSRN